MGPHERTHLAAPGKKARVALGCGHPRTVSICARPASISGGRRASDDPLGTGEGHVDVRSRGDRAGLQIAVLVTADRLHLAGIAR